MDSLFKKPPMKFKVWEAKLCDRLNSWYKVIEKDGQEFVSIQINFKIPLPIDHSFFVLLEEFTCKSGNLSWDDELGHHFNSHLYIAFVFITKSLFSSLPLSNKNIVIVLDLPSAWLGYGYIWNVRSVFFCCCYSVMFTFISFYHPCSFQYTCHYVPVICIFLNWRSCLMLLFQAKSILCWKSPTWI